MSIIVTNSSTEHPPIDDYNPPEPKVWIIRAIGLLGGIVAALAIYFIMPDSAIDIAQRAAENDPPENFNPAGLKITAATTILMGIWWMTEAIPLAATALVPLVVFPIFQVTSFGTASAPYASSTIFLFMGGFILALAMQRWNLHRRVALVTILLLGTTPQAHHRRDHARNRHYVYVGIKHRYRSYDAPDRHIDSASSWAHCRHR